MKYTDIYLIDCENMGYRRLSVKDDSLVYYFTSNSKTVENLQKNEREIHVNHNYIKDSLDFVVDSELGFLLRHYGKSVNYHIIARDRGYDIVVEFWRTKGYFIERCIDAIFLDDSQQIINKHIDKMKLTYDYAKATSGFSSKSIRTMTNIFNNWLLSKAKSYSILYNQISKSFLYPYGKQVCDAICDYLYYVKRSETCENR